MKITLITTNQIIVVNIGCCSENGASGAIGLNADMNSGIIDRFKSLPMNTTGVLLGQNFADLVRSVITLFIMSLTGFAIGWRISGGFTNAVIGYLLLLAFGFSMAWIGSTIGLSVSSPQVASTAGFAWLFPLTFLSNAFVPTETLPTWLRFFAEWNPMTSIVAAARYLFGYPMQVAPDAPAKAIVCTKIPGIKNDLYELSPTSIAPPKT